jgi:exopolysaccharide biosynthesis protein
VKKTGFFKLKRYLSIFLILIMSCTLLYAGLFLFRNERDKHGDRPDAPPGTQEPADNTPDADENSISYIHRTETINGLKQEINILEIDPGAPGVKIMPVLSHDLVYGFEKLSEMASRKNAYAAVNGGFFHEYGLPSGMVVIDGEIISSSTGNYPVFFISGGKAELKEVESRLSIRINRCSSVAEPGDATGTETLSLPVDRLNFPAGGKQVAVYTPVYGMTNRADAKNISATVENGVVTRIADYPAESRIPGNGILISFFDVRRYAGVELPVRAGDTVEFIHQPEISSDVQAYECGCWLVKDGVPVVKEKDAWVGVLTNRDPRTAVGVKWDGTVILFTVDGRQPGYSAGFTGKELAEYLVNYGVKDAAMLDGGASTEMLLEGKLVNKPSYKGEERPIGGGILVLANR